MYWLRKRKTAEPWKWSVPARLESAMLAPGMRPNSATAVEVCNLKSCTASTEIMESRLPKALSAGSAPPLDCAGRPPALTPVLALTPSTGKRLVLGRMPLVVNWPASPRVAGITRSEEHTSELQPLRH